MLPCGELGISGIVAVKITHQAEAEEVRKRGNFRLLDDAQNRAVSGVDSGAVISPLQIGTVAFSEGGSVQRTPVPIQTMDDANFVAVLKVFSDTFQNLHGLNSPAVQFRLGTDSRKH